MSKEEKQAPIRTGDPRLSTKEPEMHGTAYSLVKDENQRWNLVELKFDLASGKAMISKVEPQEGRDIANERFKISVVRAGILSGSGT